MEPLHGKTISNKLLPDYQNSCIFMGRKKGVGHRAKGIRKRFLRPAPDA